MECLHDTGIIPDLCDLVLEYLIKRNKWFDVGYILSQKEHIWTEILATNLNKNNPKSAKYVFKNHMNGIFQLAIDARNLSIVKYIYSNYSHLIDEELHKFIERLLCFTYEEDTQDRDIIVYLHSVSKDILSLVSIVQFGSVSLVRYALKTLPIKNRQWPWDAHNDPFSISMAAINSNKLQMVQLIHEELGLLCMDSD